MKSFGKHSCEVKPHRWAFPRRQKAGRRRRRREGLNKFLNESAASAEYKKKLLTRPKRGQWSNEALWIPSQLFIDRAVGRAARQPIQ